MQETGGREGTRGSKESACGEKTLSGQSSSLSASSDSWGAQGGPAASALHKSTLPGTRSLQAKLPVEAACLGLGSSRAVSTTRIGTLSYSHTKMQHIQMNSPGLMTKGTLGTHHWSDCETVNESACPLPLGNMGYLQ